MDDEYLLAKLRLRLNDMIEMTDEFATEFGPLTDDDLRSQADQQRSIADDAHFRADAIEAELWLRKLRRMVNLDASA